MLDIRQLSANEIVQHVSALAAVLHDCVQGGASVSFMSDFTLGDAEAFFESAWAAVERDERILFAAFVDGELVGTVQLILAMPPNQPHRGEVAKLLVHRSARGQGIARRLMEQVEDAARKAGKTLLVLDTATGGDAERLYASMGWRQACVIPNYAMYPDGKFCATTIFWKQLVTD